jgi:hypothetical protein
MREVGILKIFQIALFLLLEILYGPVQKRARIG